MHAALDLRAKQHLSLTPRLQQSVKLLQLSSLEFVQEIQQALVSNPFLEEEEATGEDSTASEQDVPEGYGMTTEPLDSLEAPPATDAPIQEDAGSLPETHEFEGEGSADYDAPSRQRDASRDSNDFTEWMSEQVNLREHLYQELRAYRLSERDRALAVLIIDSLDDDGYLRDSLEELMALIADDALLEDGIDESELLAALHLVQNLDPLGVGARDLSECLSLQLAAMPERDDTHTLATQIVQHHLSRLAARDSAELRRTLGCDSTQLQAAFALIRQLDPRPGARFNARQADYIIPDVIVRKVQGKWMAAANPAVMPRARLNKTYAQMFQRSQCSDRAPLAQQLQEAHWLLRNAEQRFVTIQRVAQAIVTRQRTFFEYGDVALKPLVLRQIAEELGIHESTVSRATSNKYMATPRGIFELRHFFSRELATDTGGKCSAAAIRALLKEMIDAESADAPLSDVSLTQMLADQGVIVARRTVSKYRGMMKVAPAELRRQV
ncbi:MAG: RNA polymerase factor sigma-54 [Rhodocyclaceae bacterium]